MIQTILLISFARFCHRGYEDKPSQNLRFLFRFQSHIRLFRFIQTAINYLFAKFHTICHAVYYDKLSQTLTCPCRTISGLHLLAQFLQIITTSTHKFARDSII